MANTPETTPEIKLLQRYRAGTCTSEEARQVDEWFEAQKNEVVPPLLRRRSVREINKAVLQGIKPPRQKQRNVFVFLKVAAVLLLTAMAGLFTYQRLHQAKRQILSYTTIGTKAGERKTVVLPDGTQISLNNVSSIRFVTDFNEKIRTVSLSGQAFFKVHHDANRPFIVSAGKLKVQVLGTSFDVKAFHGESKLKVSVASGKVGVYAKNGTPAHMLLPGDKLIYDETTGCFATRKVNADDQYAWLNGTLVVKGETLEDIVRQLERCYAVKIAITNTRLRKQQFNIKQNNESLSHVLQSLSLSGNGFHYRIKNGQVLIW